MRVWTPVSYFSLHEYQTEADALDAARRVPPRPSPRLGTLFRHTSAAIRLTIVYRDNTGGARDDWQPSQREGRELANRLVRYARLP
jgi:hypothetical protein